MPASSRPDPLAKAKWLFRLAALLREGQLSGRDIVLKLYPTALLEGDGWSGIERSVRLDLNDLERLEPDFKLLKGRSPRYTIETHRTQLHPVEVMALHSAARLIHPWAPGQRLHHQQAIQKLTAWLPERVQPVVGRGFSDLGQRRRREERGRPDE
ncbi:hypothetical protein [Deinococcus sp.]|uniref:hypothetical protein n=1 Tax=Deinococcus sp. TaxID=47478 RepID=UPI003CC6099F